MTDQGRLILEQESAERRRGRDFAGAILEGLSAPQREVALHGEGPLLVLAVAGSGKTRAIVHRVACLIAERNVAPSQILCLTFTNKAAVEMRDRIGRLLGELPPA